MTHEQIVLEWLLLDTLSVSQNHLPVDNFFDVLQFRVRVCLVALSPVLHVQDNLIWTVDTHSERARLSWVQILIVSETLHYLGCFRQSLLLNPYLEPVEESSQG